jgi:hypothetical protein
MRLLSLSDLDSHRTTPGRRLLQSAIEQIDTTTPVISIYIHTDLDSHKTTPGRRLLQSAIERLDTTTPVISIHIHTISSVSQYRRLVPGFSDCACDWQMGGRAARRRGRTARHSRSTLWQVVATQRMMGLRPAR